MGEVPSVSISEVTDKLRYRNFLMAAAALMGQQQQPMYFPLLDSPSPPGVRRLQEWLEDAWSPGKLYYIFIESHHAEINRL